MFRGRIGVGGNTWQGFMRMLGWRGCECAGVSILFVA
jgi:hypothetical protein